MLFPPQGFYMLSQRLISSHFQKNAGFLLCFLAQSAYITLVLLQLCITSPNPRKSLELLAQRMSARNLRSQSKGRCFTTALKQAQRTAAAPSPPPRPLISHPNVPKMLSAYFLLTKARGLSLCFLSASKLLSWLFIQLVLNCFVISCLESLWRTEKCFCNSTTSLRQHLLISESGTQVRCVLRVSGKGENTGAQADRWQL